MEHNFSATDPIVYADDTTSIVPTLSIATAAIFVGNLLDAFRYNAHNTLSLQQTKAKGSMMSLHNAASNLGYTIGSALGVILLVTNWQTLGTILTAMSLMAAVTIQTTVQQPGPETAQS